MATCLSPVNTQGREYADALNVLHVMNIFLIYLLEKMKMQGVLEQTSTETKCLIDDTTT